MSQTDYLFSAQAKTMVVNATTTASTSTALPSSGNTLRVLNEGPNVAYISVGTGAQTATLPLTSGTYTATCTPVLPSGDITLSIPADSTLNVSVITRTGTAAVNLSVGEGS